MKNRCVIDRTSALIIGDARSAVNGESMKSFSGKVKSVFTSLIRPAPPSRSRLRNDIDAHVREETGSLPVLVQVCK
jgi:hypothetical protein